MRRPAWIALGVALAAFLAHAPAIRGGFLNWDDDTYLLENPLVERLTPAHVTRMFLSTHGANWHPLTWLSHAIDLMLFGSAPAGHHAVSVLLHALNAALVFLAFRALTGSEGRSAAVALLFAVHPLRVESVAWISERKDLLCGVFFLAALLAHARYAARPTRSRYAALLAAFLLALLSKPMAITLPIVLLLLDAWPLRRLSRAALVEKIPLFALALAAGAVTLLAQSGGGATLSLTAIPLGARATNAAVAMATYVAKTILPSGLSPYYPFPGSAGVPPRPQSLVAIAILFLLAASIASARAWRRAPYLAVGWAWCVVMLLPVIGLVQVGSQAMADRYTYLPTLGILAAIVWGATDLAARARVPRSAPRIVLGASAIVLTALTWRQIAFWHDSEALWRRALEVGPASAMAHGNLGRALIEKRRTDEGIAQYYEALRVNPGFELAHFNLGLAFAGRGRTEEAMAAFEAAVRVRPDFAEARYQIANRLARAGDAAAAIDAYRGLLRVAPRHAAGHYDLGVLLSERGAIDEAIEHYRAAIAERPAYTEALVNLGGLLLGRGDREGARGAAERALDSGPSPEQANHARIILDRLAGAPEQRSGRR